MKKNYMLCIDLNTVLQADALPQKGKAYHGDLMLGGEFDACFVEKARGSETKRNVRVYDGKFITMTYRMEDGHIRFNFKEADMSGDFNKDTYAVGVMNEIREALSGLVGEE